MVLECRNILAHTAGTYSCSSDATCKLPQWEVAASSVSTLLTSAPPPLESTCHLFHMYPVSIHHHSAYLHLLSHVAVLFRDALQWTCRSTREFHRCFLSITSRDCLLLAHGQLVWLTMELSHLTLPTARAAGVPDPFTRHLYGALLPSARRYLGSVSSTLSISLLWNSKSILYLTNAYEPPRATYALVQQRSWNSYPPFSHGGIAFSNNRAIFLSYLLCPLLLQQAPTKDLINRFRRRGS